MNLGYRHTSIAPSVGAAQPALRSAAPPSRGKKAKARAKGSHDGPLPESHGRLRRHGQQARAAPAALQDQEEAIEQPRPPDAAGPREDAQVIVETSIIIIIKAKLVGRGNDEIN